jgi:hypothetical protein
MDIKEIGSFIYLKDKWEKIILGGWEHGNLLDPQHYLWDLL